MTWVLRPHCYRINSWSYAHRYCGLSYDPKETVYADQGHADVCSADITLWQIEEDPNNVIGKVEIQDILGTLGVDTDQQKLIEIRVIMTDPLRYLLQW